MPNPSLTLVRNPRQGDALGRYQIDPWTQLDRFLILGTTGGTYYASERTLTVENAGVVSDLLEQDGQRVVRRAIEISQTGRAPRNDEAIFVLAMASGNRRAEVRSYALSSLHLVCRTASHLQQFVSYVRQFRGWGRGLRSAIADWYNLPPERLAYQVLKYQQRYGYSNRDLWRLSHPVVSDAILGAIIRYALGKPQDNDWTKYPAILDGFRRIQNVTSPSEAASIIESAHLTHEMVPSELKTHAVVWGALLTHMPYTAMIRNLATMTRVGLLTPGGSATAKVVNRLRETDGLRRSRVHPISILNALKTYSSGSGKQHQWIPVGEISNALDDAFYLSFGNVEPIGKKVRVALDVSGSMTWTNISGFNMTPREASAALAMLHVAIEPQVEVVAFSSMSAPRKRGSSSGVSTLPLRAGQRLTDVTRYVEGLWAEATDCSLPITTAEGGFDAFIVYTDSETNSNRVKPSKALASYREHHGLNSKLIVCGMTASKISIADPQDAGMLDVVGFDQATPNLIADFVRGGSTAHGEEED